MAQTHVLAAHLENHGDLIADPNVPSDHLIATFPVDAYEELWEGKGWVLVNRAGEAVPTIEDADPDRPDQPATEADRAAARQAAARKFTRTSKSSKTSEKAEG